MAKVTMDVYAFMIRKELAAGLKVLKDRTGAPEGESVRRAIAAYLTDQKVSDREIAAKMKEIKKAEKLKKGEKKHG